MPLCKPQPDGCLIFSFYLKDIPVGWNQGGGWRIDDGLRQSGRTDDHLLFNFFHSWDGYGRAFLPPVLPQTWVLKVNERCFWEVVSVHDERSVWPSRHDDWARVTRYAHRRGGMRLAKETMHLHPLLHRCRLVNAWMVVVSGSGRNDACHINIYIYMNAT